MKIWLALAVLLTVSFNLFTQETIKVISYNIRYNNPADGADQWDNRKEGLGSFLSEERADFIGLQEVLHGQLVFLREFLIDYKHVGVGRDDSDTLGEYSPILYHAEKWELLENKNKWLSQTPDVVSKGWDSNFNRILNFALFRNLRSGDTVAVFNTHFDHVAKEARTNSGELVTKWVDDFTSCQNKVVMGDFNLEPQDQIYSQLTERLSDSRDLADHRYEDHRGTYNGFKLEGKFNRRIDYVFVEKGSRVLTYDVFEVLINGRQMSDHFPVIVTLRLR